MSQANEPLVAPTFLFRFAVPCRFRRTIWSDPGVMLGPKYRLPSFGELERRPLFADVRAAWNRSGLTVTVRANGKNRSDEERNSAKYPPGLHLWIDTRHTYELHRATRYAHHFVFAALFRRSADNALFGELQPIARAKEQPEPVAPSLLPMVLERRHNGYLLSAHVPAQALTGFDPDEHPRLGFQYAVVDSELGWQTFCTGPEFPFPDDPSLWGTLELRQNS